MYKLPKIDLNKNSEEFSDGDSSQEACHYSKICVCFFAVEDSINLKRDFHFITLQHHLILDRNDFVGLPSWMPKYSSVLGHRNWQIETAAWIGPVSSTVV